MVVALGRTFITVGILILLFVGYQLWGTGIYTAREQNQLEQDFQTTLDRDGVPGPTTTTTTTTIAVPGETNETSEADEPALLAPTVPAEGDPVARIKIPKIGVDAIVVNGVSRTDLRKGPGLYPETALPGQAGNAAIAGHRTTYGAPFGDLDQLIIGDLIQVQTLYGVFRFRVTEQLIVAPSDIGVIDPKPVDSTAPSKGLIPQVTLTTCNPKYSAAQRLIVKADLAPDQIALPAPATTGNPQISEEGLSGESGSTSPAALAGLLAGLIGLVWWLLFHRHPSWATWVVGAIPFAIALFFFYSFLERVLPANY